MKNFTRQFVFSFFVLCLSFGAWAETASIVPNSIPEQQINVAKPIKAEAQLPSDVHQVTSTLPQQTDENLLKNPELTRYLLNQAINLNRIEAIKKLVKIYRTFPEKDEILVKFADAQIAKQAGDFDFAIALYRQILAEKSELTPIRIQLAIALFRSQQDNAARDQFDKANSDQSLPADIRALIEQYYVALQKRDGWKASFSTNYLRDENVNRVSSATYIENTAFRKGEAMLPQTAHGVGYYFGLERDFNLVNAHYAHFENTLYGKNYWDHHEFDDITNRTSLGYSYKRADQVWSILPFYERQWYGNHRYRKAMGVRGELNNWFTPNWQVSTALEYSQERYHQILDLNGNVKTASLTLLWVPKPDRYFFIGSDFSRNQAKLKRQSYDLRTARIGWGEEWRWGVSSRVSFSASKRQYKDNFVLGSIFYFDKARQDEIYQVNATIWKRDWHLWGITPKLNYNWRKQHSNFNSLFSYSDKTVNVFFEKTF